MKHYITRFVHYRDDENEKLKITDTYDSLEKAGSVLSDILKTKLSQNWEINAFSNEDIAELGGNIVTMVQGENSSKILSAIWVVHSTPEPTTKDGVMFPEYAEIIEDSDNVIPEKLTNVEFAEQFLDHMHANKESLATSEEISFFSNMNTSQKIISACAAATVLGLFSFPYGYYVLLKVLFFGSLIYFAIEYLKGSESTGAILVTLIVLIVLYNPVFLVELGSKVLWVFVNIGTIGFLYWLSGIINNKQMPNN